jgi:hypothetical protein
VTRSLKGKTLFITGASRGIGRAIALRAARDGANAVGHFVLQLAAVRWATHNPQRTYLPIMEQSADWSSRMIPFWPITGGVQWPPRDYLTNRSLDELTDRWGNLALSIG